jgi:hypothetical protein
MIIELTKEEFAYAAQIGRLRQEEALRKNLPDKYGFDGVGGLAVHVEGAAGELAVAKALNITWDATVNTFKSLADLVSNIEVRTRSKDYYDLLVRSDDKDESLFVLVTRKSPRTFDVVGWIKAKDAKQEQWVKTHGNRPPAYFVPKTVLQNMESCPVKST